MKSIQKDIHGALVSAYQQGMAKTTAVQSPLPLGTIFYLAERYDKILDDHPDLSTCFDEFGNMVYPHVLSTAYVPCDGGTIAPYSRMPIPGM